MWIPRIILALVMTVWIPVIAAGQSTFGGIVGVVKDPGQDAVSDAQITLFSMDDNSQHTATPNTDGA
jgi:hypothetical protein